MTLRDISNQFNTKVQIMMTDLDYFGTVGKCNELSLCPFCKVDDKEKQVTQVNVMEPHIS